MFSCRIIYLIWDTLLMKKSCEIRKAKCLLQWHKIFTEKRKQINLKTDDLKYFLYWFNLRLSKNPTPVLNFLRFKTKFYLSHCVQRSPFSLRWRELAFGASWSVTESLSYYSALSWPTAKSIKGKNMLPDTPVHLKSADGARVAYHDSTATNSAVATT